VVIYLEQSASGVTATLLFLVSSKSRMVYVSDAVLCRLSWKRGGKMSIVVTMTATTKC